MYPDSILATLFYAGCFFAVIKLVFGIDREDLFNPNEIVVSVFVAAIFGYWVVYIGLLPILTIRLLFWIGMKIIANRKHAKK